MTGGGPVFEKYFATKPPFGTENKKSEFPDAFVVNGLVEWTQKNAEPLYVISGDKPFQNACQPHKTLDEYATLSTLLDRIIDPGQGGGVHHPGEGEMRGFRPGQLQDRGDLARAAGRWV